MNVAEARKLTRANTARPVAEYIKRIDARIKEAAEKGERYILGPQDLQHKKDDMVVPVAHPDIIKSVLEHYKAQGFRVSGYLSSRVKLSWD